MSVTDAEMRQYMRKSSDCKCFFDSSSFLVIGLAGWQAAFVCLGDVAELLGFRIHIF